MTIYKGHWKLEIWLKQNIRKSISPHQCAWVLQTLLWYSISFAPVREQFLASLGEITYEFDPGPTKASELSSKSHKTELLSRLKCEFVLSEVKSCIFYCKGESKQSPINLPHLIRNVIPLTVNRSSIIKIDYYLVYHKRENSIKSVGSKLSFLCIWSRKFSTMHTMKSWGREGEKEKGWSELGKEVGKKEKKERRKEGGREGRKTKKGRKGRRKSFEWACFQVGRISSPAQRGSWSRLVSAGRRWSHCEAQFHLCGHFWRIVCRSCPFCFHILADSTCSVAFSWQKALMYISTNFLCQIFLLKLPRVIV